MSKPKWKYISDNEGVVRYYDAKKYYAEKDPSGEVGIYKRTSKRSKAQKAMSGKNIRFYEHTIFALMVLVLLFRWFMMVEYGFTDDLFVAYPDAVDVYGNSVDLYYFDVFSWFKSFAYGVSSMSDLAKVSIDSLNHAFNGDWLSNTYNVIVFVLFNLPLTLIKVACLIPLTIVGLLLGGFVYPWTTEGGWIYETIRFEVPYLQMSSSDWADFWNWLGSIVANNNPVVTG